VPGKICLQSEGGPVDYRNIVIIPILPEGEKPFEAKPAETK